MTENDFLEGLEETRMYNKLEDEEVSVDRRWDPGSFCPARRAGAGGGSDWVGRQGKGHRLRKDSLA